MPGIYTPLVEHRVLNPTTYFSKYYNNKTLSDLDIRFAAAEGKEQKFPGHRIVLCAKSRWFVNACEGRFRVSQHAAKRWRFSE
jgi:hypothetical protein